MIKQLTKVLTLGLTIFGTTVSSALAGEVRLSNPSPTSCILNNPQDENLPCTNFEVIEEGNKNLFFFTFSLLDNSQLTLELENSYRDTTRIEGNKFYVYQIYKFHYSGSNGLYKSSNQQEGSCAISENWNVIICNVYENESVSFLYIQ